MASKKSKVVKKPTPKTKTPARRIPPVKKAGKVIKKPMKKPVVKAKPVKKQVKPQAKVAKPVKAVATPAKKVTSTPGKPTIRTGPSIAPGVSVNRFFRSWGKARLFR